jgi:hypothetical protein
MASPCYLCACVSLSHRLKTVTVELEETAISKQWLDKHCSRGSVLLHAIFNAIRGLCKGKQADAMLREGRETAKYGHEFRGTPNQERLCWRGPAAIYPTRYYTISSWLNYFIYVPPVYRGRRNRR